MVTPTEHLIAVVDDDAAVCRALGRTLTLNGYRVRTFASANDYLASRAQIAPACLLADIRMPGLDGISMHRRMQAAGLDVPTIFMTAAGSVPTIVDAMRAGAADLLAKPFSPERLLEAVRAAVRQPVVSPAERRSLAALWNAAATLTFREAEVGALVASGMLNKQVASLLGISDKTVKVHRSRAMRKFAAHSLADLVRIMDRLMAPPVRRLLTVDGVHLSRPETVDVMSAALARAASRPENRGK